MSCPKPGPCSPFVSELELCCITTGGTFKDPCLLDGNPVPQLIVDNAIQAASELMWAYTGRQFGKCTVKIRPCQKKGSGCSPCEGGSMFDVGSDFGVWGSGAGFPWLPHFESGVWTNLSCNTCGDTCGCKALCETPLPYPVCCIEEVKVNGTVLGRHLYDVTDFKTLIRNSGNPVRTPLTGLNTIATGDTVMPTIAVTGPGATYPNPTLIGATFGDPNGCGVWLPNDGSFYNVQWSINGAAFRQDLMLEIAGPIGFPFEFDVCGIAKGPIAVDIISGSNVQPVVTQGGCAHVVVPASTTVNDSPWLVRVRNLNNSNDNQQIVVRPTNTGGQGLALCAVQWSDQNAIDGQCWPRCQDLLKADTEPDTYSITVTYGREVPELIKLATATLACEFIKTCAGQPCQLPQRLTSLTRQGVTVGFLDPQQFFGQGLTGIYLVDLAVKTYNPKGLLKQAYAYSPDVGHKWNRLTGKDC